MHEFTINFYNMLQKPEKYLRSKIGRWYYKLPPIERKAIRIKAKEMEIPIPQFYNWCYGNTLPSPVMYDRIEKLTGKTIKELYT